MFVTNRRMRSITGMLLAAAAGACSDAAAPADLRSPAETVPPETIPADPPTPLPVPAALAQLLVASGDAQQARQGHPVPLPLQVRAVDVTGMGVAGIVVHFGITSGGGTLANATATTGRDGLATAGPWTLGAAADPQRVAAHAQGLQALFTATANSPPAVRGTFDMTATINSYDPGWGIDMDGAFYVAVVTLRADDEGATVLEAEFDGWRAIFPDGSFDLPATTGTATFTGGPQLGIHLNRLGWSMGGTLLESGDIEGTWGCCGHISGTFTMRRRSGT